MEIKYKNGLAAQRMVNVQNIQAGTVFSANIGSQTDTIFLRTYDEVVCLSNPAIVYKTESKPLVYNYVELDATLTVSKK